MPKELDDCVQSLIKRGVDEDKAYRVCTKKLGIYRGKNKNGKATWVKK
jgi:hypothetical protein